MIKRTMLIMIFLLISVVIGSTQEKKQCHKELWFQHEKHWAIHEAEALTKKVQDSTWTRGTLANAIFDIGLVVGAEGVGLNLGFTAITEGVFLGPRLGFIFDLLGESQGQSGKKNWGWYKQYQNINNSSFVYFTFGTAKVKRGDDLLAIGGVFGVTSTFEIRRQRNARDRGERGSWEKISEKHLSTDFLVGVELRSVDSISSGLSGFSFVVTNKFLSFNYGIKLN